VLQGSDEEPASGRQIPLLGDQDVDDPAVLVNRPVKIDPPSGDFHIVSSGTGNRRPRAGQGRAASISSGVNRCTQR